MVTCEAYTYVLVLYIHGYIILGIDTKIWKSHGARGTFLLLQSCHLTTVGNNRIISPP
jgi:hypothetical protein